MSNYSGLIISSLVYHHLPGMLDVYLSPNFCAHPSPVTVYFCLALNSFFFFLGLLYKVLQLPDFNIEKLAAEQSF